MESKTSGKSGNIKNCFNVAISATYKEKIKPLEFLATGITE